MKPTLRDLVAEWEKAKHKYDIRPTTRCLRAVLDAGILIEQRVATKSGAVVPTAVVVAVLRALDAEGK